MRARNFCRITAMALLLSAVLVSGVFAAELQWERFCGRGLCVTLPGHPTVTDMETPVKSGTARLRHYVATDNKSDRKVLVSYGAYPKAFFKSTETQELLDGILNGLTAGMSGLLRTERIKSDTDGAVDYQFQSTRGIYLWAQVFVLKPSIRVVAIYSRTEIEPAYAGRLFRSLQIIDIDNTV
jgi:hypothetical protein